MNLTTVGVMTLQKAVEELSKQVGSAEALAVRLDSTYSAVHSWIKGDRVPRPQARRDMAKLAKAAKLDEAVLKALLTV